jgi:hypothetical protein
MAGPGDGGIGGIGGIGGAPGGVGGVGGGGVGGGGGGIGGGGTDGPGGVGVGAAAGIGAASAAAGADTSSSASAMGADIGLSASPGLSSTNAPGSPSEGPAASAAAANASSAASNMGSASLGMSPSNNMSGISDPSTNQGQSAIGAVNSAISAAVDAGQLSESTAAEATGKSVASQAFGAMNAPAPSSLGEVFGQTAEVPGMPGTRATPGLSVGPVSALGPPGMAVAAQATNPSSTHAMNQPTSAVSTKADKSVSPGLSDLSSSQVQGTIASIVGNPAANTTGLSPVGTFATNAPSPASMEAAALSQGLAPAAAFGPASSPNSMAAMSVPGAIGMPSEAQAIGVQPGMTMAQAPTTADKSITARLGVEPASSPMSSVDSPQAVTSFADFPAPPSSIPSAPMSPAQQQTEDGITNAFGMFGKANDMLGGMLNGHPGSVGGDYKGEDGMMDVKKETEAEKAKKMMANVMLHLYPDYSKGPF